jgi:hypothetical protein
MLASWITLVYIGFQISMAVKIFKINRMHRNQMSDYYQDQEAKKIIRKKAKATTLLFFAMVAVILFTYFFHYLMTRKG